MDTPTAVGTPLEEATEHFLLNLENRRDRSPHAVSTYRGALAVFRSFLAEQGMPTEVEHLTREHVETWLDALKANGAAPATRQSRLATLKSFFAFLVREDYVDRSSVAKVEGVTQPERLTPIVTDADIAAMRKAMKGGIRARATSNTCSIPDSDARSWRTSHSLMSTARRGSFTFATARGVHIDRGPGLRGGVSIVVVVSGWLRRPCSATRLGCVSRGSCCACPCDMPPQRGVLPLA